MVGESCRVAVTRFVYKDVFFPHLFVRGVNVAATPGCLSRVCVMCSPFTHPFLSHAQQCEIVIFRLLSPVCVFAFGAHIWRGLFVRAIERMV